MNRPEEKIAGIYRKRREISDAIDIFRFAEEFTDVEYDSIPGSADGILLKHNDRARPLIIIRDSIGQARKVFTLGHELGHLLLPWHNNPLYVDNASQLSGAATGNYSARGGIETEANRFASELLMPTEWVKRLIAQDLTLEYVISKILEVGVSDLALMYKLIDCSDGPLVFVETDKRGAVVKARRSASVKAPLPVKGQVINQDLFSLSECYPKKIYSGRVFWWRLDAQENHQNHSLNIISTKSSKTVLAEMLSDPALGLTDDEQKSLRGTLNGVIGGIKSMVMQNGQMGIQYDPRTRICQSLAHRPEFFGFLNHPKFEEFIDATIKEIS